MESTSDIGAMAKEVVKQKPFLAVRKPQLREGPPKTFFWGESFPKSVKPTHPPQGFCEIWEHETPFRF